MLKSWEIPKATNTIHYPEETSVNITEIHPDSKAVNIVDIILYNVFYKFKFNISIFPYLNGAPSMYLSMTA